MNRIASFRRLATAAVLILVSLPAAARLSHAQQSLPFTLPEQRALDLPVIDPVMLNPLSGIEQPYTVASRETELISELMTLDEAIRIALDNARVVRFLAGVTASTSGRTIYDIAVTNTAVDVQNSIFDPAINVTSTLNKFDRPGVIPDPANPGGSLITGSTTDSVNTSIGLSKRMFNGADIGMNVTPVGSYFSPGVFPLDPQFTSGVEMTLRQPLMRGYGRAANLAPVVVARIDVQRSFFQYKDSVQELVRGVIDGYWTLVAARVEVWAREQQIEQAQFALDRAQARIEEGLGRATDVAQAASALANFRASLIQARSSQILAETALRNLLGLPPSSTSEIVPVSEPVRSLVEIDWAMMIAVAERFRPDLVELKLILEADQQLLLQANNQAQPQFDGIANYRWDGIRGEMPNGNDIRSGPGQFSGFNIGVNFSVPVGLRQSRSLLRRQELIISRDQANLQQGIHQMIHQLTVNFRNIAQNYAQIAAFGEARRAALLNYENQMAEFQADRQGFLNVLQAITDWGNAVAQEARSVTQYNTELANIERQTGTILESHGIVFFEERYNALGPLGRFGEPVQYPAAVRATGDNVIRYADSGEPAEKSFDLKDMGSRLQEDSEDSGNRPEPVPSDRFPDESKTGQKGGGAFNRGQRPGFEDQPPVKQAWQPLGGLRKLLK